jgi:hypothetical protein
VTKEKEREIGEIAQNTQLNRYSSLLYFTLSEVQDMLIV